MSPFWDYFEYDTVTGKLRGWSSWLNAHGDKVGRWVRLAEHPAINSNWEPVKADYFADLRPV